MNSVLTLTSNNQQQIKDRVILLKIVLKLHIINGNTTAHWLAWGGAIEELYGWHCYK
ncbi:hypothetical protein [Candidatus Rickettsia kedanie]|uniref:Uncharacterized protein n=1 Tax=Candidatus Rickettsia kedanie TaxID=3115352 RepID=A0ABP9TWC8_9RICK